jgi:Sec-independent protein translocase protein TatA
MFVMAIALIVLGPKRLPEASRNLGKIMGSLRRNVDDFKREVALPELDLRNLGLNLEERLDDTCESKVEESPAEKSNDNE